MSETKTKFRVGLIVPSSNVTMETEIPAMLHARELVEPEKFTFHAGDFSTLFNDLQAKLHTLDVMVKNTSAKNKILETNATLLLRNNILICLKHSEGLTQDELSKATGIPEDQLKPFLEKLIVQNLVEDKDKKYKLVKK